MKKLYSKLLQSLAEISHLQNSAAVLGWDQQTYMPKSGAESRGNQLAILGKIIQEYAISPGLGELLEKLKGFLPTLDPDSDEAKIITISARDYDKATRVPVDFVVENAKVTTLAQQAWMDARKKSDFSIFLPHLAKVVDLRRQYANFFPNFQHPYDALLDDFEPGMLTSDIQAIFSDLRPKQVELIKLIGNQPAPDDSFLHLDYDESKQWDFGVEVITKFGYDWSRGRQDKAHHPFTTSFGLDDVRITTRVDPKFFNTMIFGTMHECGHALYEMGVGRNLMDTGLGNGASLGIHESQSRMWENLVGRSLPFWEFFYPRLQEIFPSQLGNVDLTSFYGAINKVQPSYIRVEADEATYNLHIMLRLELEIAIIEGTVSLEDLPEIWNSRMMDYLGVTPPNDSMGVLQDIHWSFGGLGYFSTYALGNLISAQLWEKIIIDIPSLQDQIRKGKFDDLLQWLIENIHQYGRKFESQELVKRATGQTLSPEPYLNYLDQKYREIYNL
ncbi:carboxypeptidase M32 [Chloroflexota bacterium]